MRKTYFLHVFPMSLCICTVWSVFVVCMIKMDFQLNESSQSALIKMIWALILVLLNKLLDPGCWYKFTYLMTNSADPDQLASEEASWSGTILFAKTYQGSAGPGLTWEKRTFFMCSQWAYASAQSDQSLLSAWRNCTLGYPKWTPWRFGSDRANKQADLNLCWAHYHARKPLHSKFAVVAGWLQSTRAERIHFLFTGIV